MSRGLNLSRGSNSLNSASDYSLPPHISIYQYLSVGCPDNYLPVLHDDLLVYPSEVGLLEILEPWCLSSYSLPGSFTSFLYSGSGDILSELFDWSFAMFIYLAIELSVGHLTSFFVNRLWWCQLKTFDILNCGYLN